MQQGKVLITVLIIVLVLVILGGGGYYLYYAGYLDGLLGREEPQPAVVEEVALRTPDFKYVYSFEDKRGRLYDLGFESPESTDVAAELPALAEDLQSQLIDWAARTSLGEARAQPGVELDEKALERLRSLGYIE